MRTEPQNTRGAMMCDLSKEQINKLAKEICFYVSDEAACVANCNTCGRIAWHKYKKAAIGVIKKWEKIKK